MSETLICEKCGKELKQGWQICPDCQTPVNPVKTTLICLNCEEELDPRWKLCPRCQVPVSKSLAAQSASAEPEAPSPSASDPVPEGFVYVEGGTFMMGSPETEEGRSDNEIQHQVTISGFYMGKYTVTQKEWQEVMGTSPSQLEGDNFPIGNVNWYEAVEYCNRQSQKEGMAPAYRGSGDSVTCDWNVNGYRLPTEAEWEYASKGGSGSPRGYTYSGSNNADSVAWYLFNSIAKTHPVGVKTPNSLGIYDMSGNVWELCWDWYGPYSSDLQADPRGPSSGSNRVDRGGDVNSVVAYLRSAKRDYCSQSYRSSSLGFRLVRSR